MLQASLVTDSRVYTQTSYAEARWRADTQRAVAITAANPGTVTFILTPAVGACSTETWTTVTSTNTPPVTDLTVTQSTFKDAASNGMACTGTPTGSATETVLGDAGPATTFTFSNAGGRSLTFAAGVTLLAPGAKPAGTTDADWTSTAVTLAVLDTTASSSVKPAPVHVTQLATQVSRLTGSLSGPTTFIAP